MLIVLQVVEAPFASRKTYKSATCKGVVFLHIQKRRLCLVKILRAVCRVPKTFSQMVEPSSYSPSRKIAKNYANAGPKNVFTNGRNALFYS